MREEKDPDLFATGSMRAARLLATALAMMVLPQAGEP